MAFPSPFFSGAVPSAAGGPERRPNTQRPIHRADPYAASLLGRLASKLASSVSSFFSSAPARKSPSVGVSTSSSHAVRLAPVRGSAPSPSLWGASELSADGEATGREVTVVRQPTSSRQSLAEVLNPSLWPRDNSFHSSLALPRQGEPACLHPGSDPAAQSHDVLTLSTSGAVHYLQSSSPPDMSDRAGTQWRRLDAVPASTSVSPNGDMQMGWQSQVADQTTFVPRAAPLYGDGVRGLQVHFPAAGDPLSNLEASASRLTQQQWLLQQGATGPQPVMEGTVIPTPAHTGYPPQSIERPVTVSSRAFSGYAIPGEPLAQPALRPTFNGHHTRVAPAASHSLFPTEERVASSLLAAGPIRRRGSEARATPASGPPVPVLRLHPRRDSRSAAGSLLRQEEHLTVDQLQRLYLRCQPLRWRVRLRELFRQEVESAGAVGVVGDALSGAPQDRATGHKSGQGSQVDTEGVVSVQDDLRRMDDSAGRGTSSGPDTASGSASCDKSEKESAASNGPQGSASGVPEGMKAGEDRVTNQGSTEGTSPVKGGLFGSLGQMDTKTSFATERRGGILETSKELPATGFGESVDAAGTTPQSSLFAGDRRLGDSGAQSLFGGTAARAEDGLSAGGVTTNSKEIAREPPAPFSFPAVGGGAGGTAPLFSSGKAADQDTASQGRQDSQMGIKASGLGAASVSDQAYATLHASTLLGASGPAPGSIFQGSSSLSPPASTTMAGDKSEKQGSASGGSGLFGATKADSGGKGDTNASVSQSTAETPALSKPGAVSLFLGGGSSSLTGGSNLFGKTPDQDAVSNDSQTLPTFGRPASSSLVSGSASETVTRGASLFGGATFSAVSQPPSTNSKLSSRQREPAEKPEESSSEEGITVSDGAEVGETASSSSNTASDRDAKPQDRSAPGGQVTQSEASAVPWWQQNVGKACLVQVEDDGFAPDADDDADEKETGSAPGGGPAASRHTFATPVSGGSLFSSSGTESKPATTPSSLFGTYSSMASTAASSSSSGAGGGLFGGVTTSNLFGKSGSSTGILGTGTQSQTVSSSAPPSLFVFGGGGPAKTAGEAGKQTSGSAPSVTSTASGPSGSLFGNSVSTAAPLAGGTAAAASSSAEKDKPSTVSLFGFKDSASATDSRVGGTAPAPKSSGTCLFVFGSTVGASQTACASSGGSVKRGREGCDIGAPASKSVFGGTTSQGASTTGGLFGVSSAPSASLFGGNTSSGTGGGSSSSNLFVFGLSTNGANDAATKEAGPAALSSKGASPFGTQSSTPVFGGGTTASGSSSSLSSVFGASKADGNASNPFQFGKVPGGSILGAGTGSLFGNGGTTSSTGTSLFGASLGAPGSGGSGSLFGAAAGGTATGGSESQRPGAAPVVSSPFGSQSASGGGSSGGASVFGSAVASRPLTFGATGIGGGNQTSTGLGAGSAAGSTGTFGAATGAGGLGQSGEDGNSLFGPQTGGPVIRRPRLTIKRTKK
ncbi:putative proteophosphoglycan 5, related protein [Toxoplasma gondii RUB]|uniref:Putative proteophosphoglycan 5, related protein n=1 Tax=Toxoplasma gondii RUB TaxID=935652 RepID=A0A086LYU2_TOXGO|nr:putative proteophosphoglycan 5, related protein [Toxoplasma gondii RUB]